MGDAECKYRLDVELFAIEEAWAYNLTPRLRREIREIIFSNFTAIVDEWERVHGETNDR